MFKSMLTYTPSLVATMSPVWEVVPRTKDFRTVPYRGSIANTVFPATPQSTPSGPKATPDTVGAFGTGTVSQSLRDPVTSQANTVPDSRVGVVVPSPPVIDVPP